MKIDKKITVQDWMKEEGLIRIFEKIAPVLCVGGAVRNVLMGREVEDVDLATPMSPQEVIEKLTAAGIKVVPTGIDHGTVTAVINKKPYEITTLRKDVETDGRRAVVAYTADWAEDAQRRDFTVNTLLLDLQGNVYDPLGSGLADIENGVVRFVGEPDARIAEDYLRILRYFRFHALYGKGEFEPMALAACARGADKVATLSRERITTEIFKIIASEKPQDILKVMFANGILKEFEFAAYDPELFGHFVTFQSRYTLVSVPSRILLWAGLQMDNIRAMEKYLLFPKVFLKDMQAISGALTLPDLSCDSAVRVSMYKYGKGITAQALMIELAQDRVMNGYAPSALKVIQTWEVPDFPVSGNDLMALGISQGKELGQALDKLEEWWIGQDFKPGKAECLKQLS